MTKTNFLGGDDARSAAARHRAIADDLDRLATTGIAAVDLASCPLLDGWTVDFGAPSCFLRGIMSGHPSVPAGAARTGNLVALDMEAGWARSWSRSYRLGTFRNAGDGR